MRVGRWEDMCTCYFVCCGCEFTDVCRCMCILIESKMFTRNHAALHDIIHMYICIYIYIWLQVYFHTLIDTSLYLLCTNVRVCVCVSHLCKCVSTLHYIARKSVFWRCLGSDYRPCDKQEGNDTFRECSLKAHPSIEILLHVFSFFMPR